MPNWKKVIVSGSDASLNSLNVDTSLTASGLIYPTTDTGEFSFIQSDGNGNLSLEYVNTIYESVYNGELTQILKGTPLYVSGAVGAESIVYRADAGDPNRMPVTYIAADNIDAASSGKGIILGLITGVDTTGYSPGTEIYVGVGGGWTSTRPSGSNIAQLLGIVTKEGNGGQGIVLNPGPFNTPNLESGQIFWGDNTDNVVKKPLAHILSGSSFIYSGSFSGSFEGDGSNLTGIQVASLQSNFNVTPFTSTGSITINHNLNATYPLVQVYDSSDNQIIPDTIEVIDADNVKITFATPRTGNVVIGKGGDIIDLTQVLPPTTRAITGSFTAVTSSIITHAFQTENVLVSVYDNTKSYIIPDSIQILDGDNVQIEFSTPTTGYAVITNGGHIVSGSIEWDNVLNKPSGIVSSSAQLSDATIPGNLIIQGTLTAQQFNTEFVSASIIYRSGSTKFGDTLDDIHSFTGSLEISGSLISDGDVLPHTTDIYNLGSPTKRWGDVYLTSASIYLNNTKLSATSDGKVSGSFTGSFIGDGSQLSGVTSYTNDDTLSYINTLGVVSSSAQLSTEISGAFISTSSSLASDISTNDGRLTTLEGKTLVSGSSQISFLGIIGKPTLVSGSSQIIYNQISNIPSGIISSSNQLSNQTIPGDLTVGGILTAQEFHTEFVSASIIYDSGSTQFGNSLDDVHNFSGSLAVNTNNLFVSGGRVGIGTALPQATLNIRNSVNTSTTIPQPGFSNEYTQLYLTNSDDKYGLLFGNLWTGTSWMQVQRTDSTATVYNLALQPNGGNVGIGTTSPTALLDVIGGQIWVRSQTNDSVPRLKLIGNTATGDGEIDGGMGGYNLLFKTNGSEKMRVNANGNVGIGTTSPVNKLSVVGGIQSYTDTHPYYVQGSLVGSKTTIRVNNPGASLISVWGGTGWSWYTSKVSVYIATSGASYKRTYSGIIYRNTSQVVNIVNESSTFQLTTSPNSGYFGIAFRENFGGVGPTFNGSPIQSDFVIYNNTGQTLASAYVTIEVIGAS